MNRFKIIIVIVTYNGIQWIKKCIESCENYSIIVVDNASTDKTVSFIETNYPHIIILKQKENLGFGQANNIGISKALKMAAEHVFLLNQDAYLKPKAIETLLNVASTNSDYGILSPLHINGQETALDSNFLKFIERSNTHNTLLYDYSQNSIKSIYSVAFVNAAAWLISKTVLLNVGGFDPLFFHYGEDRNYCQRLQYYGYKIGIVPSAIVLHDRENRKNNKAPLLSRDHFKDFEKYTKVDLGDINESDFQAIKNKKLKKLNNQFFKSIFKCNVPMVRDALKKRRLVNKLTKEILVSRDLNKKKKANYLDF